MNHLKAIGRDSSIVRRSFNKIALLGVISAIGVSAATFSASVLAQAGATAPGAERSQRGGFDPQRFQARRDERLRQMLGQVGASEQQITQIQGIWRTAQTDLAALGTERRAGRQAIGAALALPVIDRRAIEQLRAQQMQLADRSSQRMTTAMADAAEVLDPQQRQKLAELMKQRGGRFHGRGPGGVAGQMDSFEPTT